MTYKVYVVTDLGSGDGGKGSVVHAVAKSQRAHTVIKRGGAQAGHGVKTSAGKSFTFSQWGCGTLDGIPTHLSHQMVVSPEGLLNEAAELRSLLGVNPFDMLTIDKRALVSTPFHGIASRLFELSLGNTPRGTVGTGVGQAYRDMMRYPELKLTVGDLMVADLRERLEAIRNNVVQYVLPVVEDAEFLRSDSIAVRHELSLLRDDNFIDFVHRRFREVSQLAQVVDPSYFPEVVLTRRGVAVIETSHGVLTDRVYGFSPHTSAIRTLPSITRRILDDSGYEGKIVNIGVSRAYAVRHGAGPLPTDDPKLVERLLPGVHEQYNRWQGRVRVGALDGVLLRYAINVCGGKNAFDGLAFTWIDQVKKNGDWLIANRYEGTSNTAFTPQGELRIHRHPTPEGQEELTRALQKVAPVITRYSVDSALTADALYAHCAEIIGNITSIPVRMISMGPTELDKLMK